MKLRQINFFLFPYLMIRQLSIPNNLLIKSSILPNQFHLALRLISSDVRQSYHVSTLNSEKLPKVANFEHVHSLANIIPYYSGHSAARLRIRNNFHCKVTCRPARCKGFRKIFLFSTGQKRVFAEHFPCLRCQTPTLQGSENIPDTQPWEAELRERIITGGPDAQTNPKGMGRTKWK